MATERNVVDFKIHNLTEEQFQELKAQGKIDPNAVYCTPDESLKKDQITNCITEIPQDIKLELADGVLTLKAGSIVYVPNGAGVFNKRTATTNVTTQNLSSYPNGQYLVFDNSDLAGTSLRCNLISACYSGATAPATGTVWYDTTNNKIVVASGGAWTGNRTLPLGIVTISNGAISSIDQVFNGFGYIGSTIFTLPGVKGLMPDGINADGTLRNSLITTVISTGQVPDKRTNQPIIVTSNGQIRTWGGIFNYDTTINRVVSSQGSQNIFLAGTYSSDSSGKITSSEPKTAFHAVDYSDFENTVEELDNSVVHKTGDETIGGEKTFTSTIRMQGAYLHFDGINSTAAQSFKDIDAYDTNGATVGGVRIEHSSTNGRSVSLITRKADGSVGGNLGVRTKPDGTYSSFAPTPASTSNSTEIATTAWSNAKFLPLTGGTMNGTITRSGTLLAKRNVDNSYLEIDGGTNYLNGAYLRLDGKDNGDYSGRFTLATGDGSKNKLLIGRTDGSLFWNSQNVLTDSYCGSTTQKIGLYSGGKGLVDYTDGGAWLQLLGSNSQSGAYESGKFVLGASLGANNKMSLVGKANGVLQWNNQNVATVTHESFGQNGCVKFNNGLIIQWGLTEQKNGVIVVTLPVPFTGKYTYAVTATLDGKSASAASVQARTNTTFSVDPATGHDSANKRAAWIAIGY